MPITVNLRHLAHKNVQLEGEISPQELDVEDPDEMIHTREPLRYDLEVEQSGNTLLVEGKLDFNLNCECVRCLKPFKFPIKIDPYNLFVPLEGEDKAPINNDLVDLTPYLREDILLAFPQHPLCEAECDRVPESTGSKEFGTPTKGAKGEKSAWDELNKLKFK
jgi:uncharacterized metal-binding protein YceD (DUF177 family)